MEFEEWIQKYKCDKKKCVCWGYPQYGGICCGLNRSKGKCDYFVIKRVSQKLIDDF